MERHLGPTIRDDQALTWPCRRSHHVPILFSHFSRDGLRKRTFLVDSDCSGSEVLELLLEDDLRRISPFAPERILVSACASGQVVGESWRSLLDIVAL